MSVEVLDSDSSDSDIFVVKQIKPINKLTIQQALIIKHGVLNCTQPRNSLTLSDVKKKAELGSYDKNERKPKRKKTIKSWSSPKNSVKKEQKDKKNKSCNGSTFSKDNITCSEDIMRIRDNENSKEQNYCKNISSPATTKNLESPNSSSKIIDYFSPTKLSPKKEQHSDEKKIDLENVQLSPGILRKKRKFQIFRSDNSKLLKLNKCTKKIFLDSPEKDSNKKNLPESHSQSSVHDLTNTELFDFDPKDMFSDFNQEEKFPVEDLLNIIDSYEDLEEGKCRDNSELLCFILKKIIRDETKKQMQLGTNISANIGEKPEKLISQEECEIFEKFFNLKESACKLYVRMLSRKKGWHRASRFSYKDISNDLTVEFSLLQNVNFLDSNIGEEDLKTQIELLSKSEVQQLCKAFNVSFKSMNLGKKRDLINLLINETKKQKSVLEMIQKKNKTSRLDLLFKETKNLLGMCVKLNDVVFSAFNKILLLFSFPHYIDEEEKRISNQLFMCINVFRNVIKFPNYKLSPTVIFKTRSDFEKFAKALEIQSFFEIAIAAKNLDNFVIIGNKAKEEFLRLLNDIEYQKRFMNTESFLQKFSAGSILAKILTKFCDLFKRKSDIKTVVKITEILLDQNIFLKQKRGKWFNILSHAYENLKESNLAAEVIIRSLEEPGVDEVQRMTLQLKGLALLKKKTNGITENNIREKLDELCIISVPEPASIEIRGKLLEKNIPGFKCVYIEENENGKFLTSVEERAILYYKSQGFEKGYHTEGYLLQTIYFLLFFDIIYGMSPPGVFQSPYQEAPLDFYSKYFYLNRKEAIDLLLSEMSNWTLEEVEKKLKEVYYKNFNVTCLISWEEKFTPEFFCEIIKCITMPILTLICQRYAHNFRAARAGFPDLTLWNPHTKKCKFVEVKSHNDRLSPAQRLWLNYLRTVGLDCEVCNVRNTPRNFSEKKANEDKQKNKFHNEPEQHLNEKKKSLNKDGKNKIKLN